MCICNMRKVSRGGRITVQDRDTVSAQTIAAGSVIGATIKTTMEANKLIRLNRETARTVEGDSTGHTSILKRVPTFKLKVLNRIRRKLSRLNCLIAKPLNKSRRLSGESSIQGSSRVIRIGMTGVVIIMVDPTTYMQALATMLPEVQALIVCTVLLWMLTSEAITNSSVSIIKIVDSIMTAKLAARFLKI